VSVVAALLLVALVSLLAVALGVWIGLSLAPRIAARRQRRSVDQDGITVSQMLTNIVGLSPVGTVVVDTYRDVVYMNDKARELGLVRDRLLDDRAWAAAQRTLATGLDVDFDLAPVRRQNPGRSGISVGGHVRTIAGSPWSTSTTSPSTPGWRPPAGTSWPTSVTNSRRR
jgi:two-component system, OmpR family, sensor histidine kinase SenX3